MNGLWLAAIFIILFFGTLCWEMYLDHKLDTIKALKGKEDVD